MKTELPKTETPSPAIVWRNPADIKFNPLAERMPGLLAEDDPRFIALVASVRERGIDQPLLLDPDGRLIDGRNRLAASRAAELPAVPCLTKGADEVASVIIESLVARRHYTKGALAYLAYPLLKTGLEEARKRAAEKQAKNLKFPTNPRETTQSSLEAEKGRAATLEALFRQWGFSRDLLLQAEDVHELLDQQPGLRTEWETKILSGEVGLGAALAGIKGLLATKGKQKKKRSVELLEEAARAFQLRLKYFDDIQAPAQRIEAAAKLADAIVTAAPPEVLRALKRRLKEKGE